MATTFFEINEEDMTKKRNNIKSDSISLGEFMRQLRKDAGLHQKDLADRLGVKPVTYSAYENGRITPPADKLYALAQYYDINVELLMSKLKGHEDGAQSDTEIPAINAAKEEIAMLEELAYYFRNLSDAHKKAVFDLAKTLYVS